MADESSGAIRSVCDKLYCASRRSREHGQTESLLLLLLLLLLHYNELSWYTGDFVRR